MLLHALLQRVFYPDQPQSARVELLPQPVEWMWESAAHLESLSGGQASHCHRLAVRLERSRATTSRMMNPICLGLENHQSGHYRLGKESALMDLRWFVPMLMGAMKPEGWVQAAECQVVVELVVEQEDVGEMWD